MMLKDQYMLNEKAINVGTEVQLSSDPLDGLNLSSSCHAARDAFGWHCNPSLVLEDPMVFLKFNCWFATEEPLGRFTLVLVRSLSDWRSSTKPGLITAFAASLNPMPSLERDSVFVGRISLKMMFPSVGIRLSCKDSVIGDDSC
jgi:hypothetical protein